MIITVRKKEFNIELVSNYVHKLYSELTEESYLLSEATREIQDIGLKWKKEIVNIKDAKQISEENKKFNKEVLNYNQKIKEYTKNIVAKRWSIIKELVEVNGYNFDYDWWERKTGVEDLNDFMLKCLGDDKNVNKNGYGKKK